MTTKSVNKEEEKNSSRELGKVEPSHIMTGEYAALMETNGKECESWYYFIRKEGNETALRFLQDQLEKVEWYIVDDLSTFDLDLTHYVDAKTAKEMTKLELNSHSFHRKFDGKLDMIDFKFKKRDLRDNERMICKVFDHLGYGQIEDFITDEDLDDEDLVDNEDIEDSDEDDTDDEDDDTDNESSSDDSDESDDNKNIKKVSNSDLPPSLFKNRVN